MTPRTHAWPAGCGYGYAGDPTFGGQSTGAAVAFFGAYASMPSFDVGRLRGGRVARFQIR